MKGHKRKVKKTGSKPKHRSSSRPRSTARKGSHKTPRHARSAAVSRSRATTPARSTHTLAKHKIHLKQKAKKARRPIPLPLPTRHIAPPRPAVAMPARSMPPAFEIRKLDGTPARGPLAIPDFSEAGILLAITYSIREGRRGEFFDIMRELKPLLAAIGGLDCTVYEDRSRPNYFMEVFRFKDEPEFTAFDDKFHKDRKIAAIYALLDDIVEAEKSDFKIFERRL